MRIFLIDDDSVDSQIVRRVLKGVEGAHELVAFSNAGDALRELRREFEASDRAPARGIAPGLILLDLNMPGMSGFDFLRETRSDTRFAGIPVVVLTTSGLPSDVQACFEQGVDGYFVKPLEYAQFADLLTRIIDYWRLCETPQRFLTILH
jgi:CheY-like chemotaxis protein